MRYTKQVSRFFRFGMSAYAGLALLYLLLIFVLPANQQTMQAYNLTNVGYRIILFTIAVPSLVVWFLAFLAYARLQTYARAVSKTREGSYLEQLAKGCGWLAWSLPAGVILTFTLNSIANKWPDFHPTATIMANYVNMLLPLIAFTIISSASRGLFTHANLRYKMSSSRVITLLFVVGGVLYCYLTFRRLDLHSLSSSNNLYFLPIWLLVLTLTIPFLYTWFLGILAVYEITLYGKAVPGIFYRQALNLLVVGLSVVIISFIARQYLLGVAPQSGYLVLDLKLGFLLALRILGGVGFALMSWGAYKLIKIEEV